MTHPCQRDGPEGYDSPVPASERPGHQAQARAWQAITQTTAHKHTQTHTTPFIGAENLLTKAKNMHATIQAADKILNFKKLLKVNQYSQKIP